MRISDWSSDVCSSDLFEGGYDFGMGLSIAGAATFLDAEVTDDSNAALIGKTPTLIPQPEIAVRAEYAFAGQLDGLTLGDGARHRGASQPNAATTPPVTDPQHHDPSATNHPSEGVGLNPT